MFGFLEVLSLREVLLFVFDGLGFVLYHYLRSVVTCRARNVLASDNSYFAQKSY